MKYGLFFVQKGVLFTKECIKQFGEVRKFLSKLCISPLTRFAFSYPRGATFKLLPCLRGAVTKWLRGREHPARDLSLPVSSIK